MEVCCTGAAVDMILRVLSPIYRSCTAAECRAIIENVDRADVICIEPRGC